LILKYFFNRFLFSLSFCTILFYHSTFLSILLFFFSPRALISHAESSIHFGFLHGCLCVLSVYLP
jgi:hypothetical protein